MIDINFILYSTLEVDFNNHIPDPTQSVCRCVCCVYAILLEKITASTLNIASDGCRVSNVHSPIIA